MYDLIIIGGGMSGISVGHFFRDRKILILEKHELLSGASGKNAGFIVSGFGEHFNRTAGRWGRERAVQIQDIHLANHKKIREIAATLECGYNPGGSLSLALDEHEELDLRESFQQMLAEHFFIEWLDHPPAGVKNCRGALFNPADASIDPLRFWGRLAADLPCQVNCEVLEVEARSGSQVVRTTAGTFESARVVFCLNAYSSGLVPELSGRIIPLRGQMLEIPLQHPPPTSCPVMTQYGDIYWRFGKENLIFGGLENLVPEQELGISDLVSQAITEKQLEWIRDRFDPVLIGPRPAANRAWCGTMAFTVDGFPIVGPLPRENQHVLAGLCGLGHGYAMECASWLFDLITTGRDLIPTYMSSARIETLPVYAGGNWRKLYEAWNH